MGRPPRPGLRHPAGTILRHLISPTLPRNRPQEDKPTAQRAQVRIVAGPVRPIRRHRMPRARRTGA